MKGVARRGGFLPGSSACCTAFADVNLRTISNRDER